MLFDKQAAVHAGHDKGAVLVQSQYSSRPLSLITALVQHTASVDQDCRVLDERVGRIVGSRVNPHLIADLDARSLPVDLCFAGKLAPVRAISSLLATL